MKQTKQIDAFERRGIKVLLKLSLKCETPDAAFVQEILKYKNIITEINIALYHDSYDYLLKEDFYFKSLEKIYISPEICSDDCCDEHLNLVKESCNKFISRYANQLQHLAISSMDFWEENDINVNNLAYITNLKSLSLKNFIDIDGSFIIKSINFYVASIIIYHITSIYTKNWNFIAHNIEIDQFRVFLS